jgi:hypothetical protein
MSGQIHRPEEKHPPEYQRDLNPNASAGLNYGLEGPHPEKENPRTAYDIKDLHRQLRNLLDDQLRLIPVLPPGSRLEEGATYLDLKNPGRHEFTGRAAMITGPEEWIIPKKEVPFQLWNRLLGINNPERTGEA